MTRPETCGAAGGAISVWLNVVTCSSSRPGIISSLIDGASGTVMYCNSNDYRYYQYIT